MERARCLIASWVSGENCNATEGMKRTMSWGCLCDAWKCFSYLDKHYLTFDLAWNGGMWNEQRSDSKRMMSKNHPAPIHEKVGLKNLDFETSLEESAR